MPLFDVETIEQDLSNYLESVGEQSDSAVSRVCRANIILPLLEGDSSSQTLARVSSVFPSRGVLVQENRKLEPKALSGWASASCESLDDGVVVCSEAIHLEHGSHAKPLVPSAVLALMVGSVPRAVLSKRISPESLEWVHELESELDLIVGDSVELAADDGVLLWERCVRDGKKSKWHDLAWERLLPWRQGAASVLEDFVPNAWERLTHVHLKAGKPGSAEAALFTAWMAVSLDWQLVFGEARVDARASNGLVSLTVERTRGSGLQEVEFELDNDLCITGVEPEPGMSQWSCPAAEAGFLRRRGPANTAEAFVHVVQKGRSTRVSRQAMELAGRLVEVWSKSGG